MTKRQQRRAEKAKKQTPTQKQSIQTKPLVKKANNINNTLKKVQLEKISGYLKGILKVKQEQEERELMWKLINKYESEVIRAFTPYA